MVNIALWESFYRKGQRCMAGRDYQRAVKEFKKVLNNVPHHRGAHYFLAESLLRIGLMQEAIETIERMQTFFPTDPQAALALGRLLLKAGRKAEGIDALERALAITHHGASGHFRAAARCRAEGNVSCALSELQEGCLGFKRAANLRLFLVNLFLSEKRVDDAFRVAGVNGTPASGESRPARVGRLDAHP